MVERNSFNFTVLLPAPNPPYRQATHLQFLWCCTGSWAEVITYHQVTRTLVCLVFSIKKKKKKSFNDVGFHNIFNITEFQFFIIN